MEKQSKLEGASLSLLERFRKGDLAEGLAKALPVFLRIDKSAGGSLPSSKWSMRNILLLWAKTDDVLGAGFNQWPQFGRKVRKGAKAAAILIPCFPKKEEQEQEEGEVSSSPLRYKGVSVFGISHTEPDPEWEGEPLVVERDDSFINDLPLLEVAEAWGIQVKAAYSSVGEGGWTDTKSVIAICNSSEKTFLHELSHVADLKGKKVPVDGTVDHAAAELVAEFSASLLMQMLSPEEPPQKASWKYLEHYAKMLNKTPEKAVMGLLGRVCGVVEKIAAESKELQKAA